MINFILDIPKLFNTKYFYFVKIDIRKYYLNINLKILEKAIIYFIKKRYTYLTAKAKKLLDLLKSIRNSYFQIDCIYEIMLAN
jgi:hypothetical protein